MSNNFSVVPTLLHVNCNTRNGMIPNAWHYYKLCAAENFLTAYGTAREVYSYQWELGGALVTTSGTVTLGRFRFRTSRSATALKILFVMGLPNPGHEVTAARMEVDVTISGGATTTETFYYGQNNTNLSVDAPDEWSTIVKSVAVNASTVYEVFIKSVGIARPIAVTCWEATSLTHNTSVLYYNQQNPVAGQPIYDSHRERILAGLSNMYRQGGTVYNWHLQDGAARTRTSLVPINILDNTTTGTPTTADYGFYIDPRWRRTASRTTVPYEISVYGSIAAGSGSVRLIDTSGNTYGTTTINGAAGWYTATFSLTESAEIFLVPQFLSDAVNSMSVYALSIGEYESGP